MKNIDKILRSFQNYLPILLSCMAMQSCTQQFLVSANVSYDAGLSKEKSHYIVPPSGNYTIEQRNLYPVVKSAMIKSGIEVANKPSDANFLVIYTTASNSSQTTGTRYVPSITTTTGTVRVTGSPYSSNTANYTQTTSGGSHIPYSRQYNMKSYIVSVRNKSGEVWRGIATAEDNRFLDLDQMVSAMFIDYGKNRETTMHFR